MDEEISQTRMELAIRYLERRAAKIEGIPTLKGVPATAFDTEHLVMLCKLFADEWQKAQAKYYELLEPLIPADRLKIVIRHLEAIYQPSLWRRIWKRIKKASSTPDSAQDGTKTSAKA